MQIRCVLDAEMRAQSVRREARRGSSLERRHCSGEIWPERTYPYPPLTRVLAHATSQGPTPQIKGTSGGRSNTLDASVPRRVVPRVRPACDARVAR
ncbi:hypothetical protein SKAU_G00040220 [Synaphobranchus kaupii]|uniref:Uncharacterized protein n=1 Tax=Synaphobranchus kaupii TaxID=118154 RepID=A0A9Q1J8S4_SYNKA|nr:hypothetical protein SKAU_G00040220 [Synaphobranchus kaupii]